MRGRSPALSRRVVQDASLLRFLVDMRGEDATNQQVGPAPPNSARILAANHAQL